MAETTPPLYMNVDNFFDAAALALPWRDVFGAGVVGAGDLLVSAGTGMQVSVATGVAWVPGTDNVLAQGCYRCTNNGAKNLTIAAADPTNPRVDTVIAHVYDSEFAGTQLKWALEVLTGTATSGATLLTLTGKAALPTTGYSYVLGYVLVPAAASSSASFSFLDTRRRVTPGSGAAAGGMTEIFDYVVPAGGSLATLDTQTILTAMGLPSSIPQTFRNLRATIRARGDYVSAAGTGLRMQINGDSSAQYNWETTYTSGAAAPQNLNGAATSYIECMAASLPTGFTGTPADAVGQVVLDFCDYVNTVFMKTVSGHGGAHTGSSGVTAFNLYGEYNNAAALSRLTFFPQQGGLVPGTRFTLCGS